MGIPDNPPAFPQHVAPAYRQEPAIHGMTLRDWFAGRALAGMASIATDDGDMLMGWADMAKASYLAADAMLAARVVAEPEPEPAPPPEPIQVPPAPDACRYCNSGLPERQCECVPF